MTRVVVRRSDGKWTERPHQGSAREELGDIDDLASEGLRPPGPCRIVAEQISVGLHVRTAAGRIDHDRLYVGGLERGDRRPREGAGGLGLARVGMERAAAALRA